MSDPLSVAGTAVGIVSLGLTVCGEIVKYVQALSSQSSDLQNLATKASSVNAMLKSLEKLINDVESHSPEIAKDLAPQLLCLKRYVDTLDDKIRKFAPVQAHNTPNTIHSKARSALHKATYPFKKEDISEARHCLEGMEITLGATLGMYTFRNTHVFGLQLDSFLKRLESHQLAITASSQQSIPEEKTSSQSLSYGSNHGVQGCRTPPARNWDIHRVKQTRKQYSYYSWWLKRAFTLTLYFSTRQNEFIGPSLRCDTIVGDGSWLHMAFRERNSPLRIGFLIKQPSAIDDLIQEFEVALSEGKVRPTDHLVHPWLGHLSILDLLFFYPGFLEQKSFPVIQELIMYLLDHGVTTYYRSRFSPLRWLCGSYIWGKDSAEYGLALDIIERFGPINWVPLHWAEKRNIQRLLHGDDDYVDLPAAYIAVLRESYEDLRCLLESRSASSEDSIDGVTLLQLAMGWPEGVRLLLDTGSNNRIPRYYHLPRRNDIFDHDNNIQEYINCCQILLEAGYTISYEEIHHNSSDRLRSVFIEELAKRRRKLLDISKAQLPPAELSELRGGETGLPDSCAPRIWAALIAKGIQIDRSLEPIAEVMESIFCYSWPSELLNQIYEAGFTDIDQPLSDKTTPLMELCGYYSSSSDGESVSWLISKGASPYRKLPGLHTTIIHNLNARLASESMYGYRYIDHFDPGVELHYLREIEAHLLSISIMDECACSCSVGGCTPLSVAIRGVVASLYIGPNGVIHEGSAFRRFLEFLIHHNQSKLDICHTIIRNLTFDGLKLTHTCCTELHEWYPWDHVREECDLEEIREEQKEDLARLETIVSDLQAEFDALGLPLMKFLQDIWYERMIKFLSHRDVFDQEHIEGSREAGVFLKADDSPEIPLCVQLICPDVRVVESDSEDS